MWPEWPSWALVLSFSFAPTPAQPYHMQAARRAKALLPRPAMDVKRMRTRTATDD
jgi:hypothetical protein